MRMSPYSLRPGDPSAIKGVKINRHALRRAWSFAGPYRLSIALFMVAIVVSAVLGILPPLLFRQILDNAIPQKNRGEITFLATLLVVAAMGDAFLSIVQRWFSTRIGEGMIYDLRVALFDKVERMPIAFFTRTQTGSLISRLNNDVIGAQDAVTNTLGSVVSNVVVLVTTMAAMLTLEWRLTLLSLIVLPLFIIPAKRVGRKLSAISREQMNMNATMNTQMTERFNVSGALLVKLFGSRRTEVSTFAGRAAKVRDAGIKQAMYGRTFLVALGLVAAVGAAAIYGIGAHLVVSGTIKVGTLVALAALAPRLYQPLTGLTNTRVDMMTALVSFDRVFEVLDAPVAIADKLGAVDLVDPQGRIELRDVWFRYPPAASSSIPSLEAPGLEHSGDPDQDVLKGISLVVEPGETVALVGSSGAGKTTLSSLLPRLYDVTGGAVLIDGLDIRNVTLDSLTAAIGVVSQDPHLFHESVLSNLLYARPDASMEAIEVACRGARIYDMINALPDRFETIVGDRGYRMSGGEKQRLAIARLLLKQPAIVILDEATSHLDNENEAQVQAALEMALSGRTALIIAHRLSTIRNADRIVVLDAGQIVEQGTHEELIALGGFYARQEYLGENHSPVTDDR